MRGLAADDFKLAGIVSLAFIFLGLIWFARENRVPTQDECIHILNAISFKELLVHGRPWQPHWWYQCFTVSKFYPPFVYSINGIFLLLFGESRLVEHIAQTGFTGLLVVSTYSAARLLGGGRVAASTVGLFLLSYPLIAWLGHTFFLDLPAVAMIVSTLVIFLWSRQVEPSYKRTLASGFVIGAALLTKQLVCAYAFPIAAYYLAIDLVGLLKSKDSADVRLCQRRLSHTLLAVLVAALLCMPFLAATFKVHDRWLDDNVDAFAKMGIHHSVFSSVVQYFASLPMVMSLPMLIVFVGSLLILRKKEFKQLQPVFVMTGGGLILSCMPLGTDLEMRYLSPFLILPAFVSSFAVERLFEFNRKPLRLLSFCFISLAIAYYFSFSFLPYPVAAPPLPFVSISGTRADVGNATPIGYEEWGYPFVLREINKFDAGKAVILNILPNHHAVHTSAYWLFLHEQKNIGIFPTNSRKFTIIGDKFQFDEASICFPTWYLQKTGDTGFLLAGAEAKQNYARLIDFIKVSGKYVLVARKTLPDHSELLLYRKKP